MRKRLLLIALVLILSTGTVVTTEMRAEAAGTVTAVAVVKGVLVLLAIAGVGITLGSIFDQGDIEESAVTKFTTWLNNHDPEFYTEFMVAATAITAGRVINTWDALFFQKLRQNVREYFGTDVNTSTSVGSTSFNIRELAFLPNGSQSISTVWGNLTSYDVAFPVLPVSFMYNSMEVLIFIAAYEANLPFTGFVFPRNDTSIDFTYNGNSYSQRLYYISSASFPIFNSELDATNTSRTQVIETIYQKYYSGDWASVSEDLVMKPFTTVGNVAATSADATVVGAGQTITEDGEGEIVIDGDTTFNLSNVNIDEWLKALAEGTATYAQAMQAIGLAAVNTQTQTLEEVQAIAQALNPAAAGTGTITGNYTVALTDLFPFCIPFDLYKIIACFKADPVAPSAEITIPVGYDGSEFTWETYTVSLSAFDPVAAVVRVLEYVAFIIGLMLITRKLIEG